MTKAEHTPPKPAESSQPKHGAKQYSDGHPLDEVHYREYKILLKPDRFATARGFKEFAKLLRHAADDLGVALTGDEAAAAPHQIREIVFFDTPKFDLYNHAFILRKRTIYQDGLAVGDPELAFKYRHVDIDTAATIDVRPGEHGAYRVKFKEELLPLRDRVGGIRSLFSHNCVLGVSVVAAGFSIANVAKTFPALRQVEMSGRKIELVNHVAVEEVLAELGELHFGHGLQAKTNVASWRRLADDKPFIGEFAFQCRFVRADELHKKAKRHSEEFFTAFQKIAADWVEPGVTKTSLVYTMGKRVITNHE
jgi:hypothetical protein